MEFGGFRLAGDMGALGGAATLELYVPTMSDPDLHPRRFRSLHLVGSIGKFVEENFRPQRSGGGFRLVTVGGLVAVEKKREWSEG